MKATYLARSKACTLQLAADPTLYFLSTYLLACILVLDLALLIKLEASRVPSSGASASKAVRRCPALLLPLWTCSGPP